MGMTLLFLSLSYVPRDSYRGGFHPVRVRPRNDLSGLSSGNSALVSSKPLYPPGRNVAAINEHHEPTAR